MLVDHRAKLDGVPEVLGNKSDPLMYGDRRLVDKGLPAGLEGVLNLCGQSRGVECGTKLHPHTTGSFKFFQFLCHKLGVTLDILAGVGEVVATIADDDSAGHGDSN